MISRIPHLLQVNGDILDIRGKSVCLYLDYDGTLTPIVSDPADATLDPEMYGMLLELVSLCSVGIVTGRGYDLVSGFLKKQLCERVCVAASHGFDIRLSDGRCKQVGDADHTSELSRFNSYLLSHLDRFPSGCTMERTDYSISLHYRHVPTALHASVESTLTEMLRAFSGLVVTGGKMVFEVRLNVDWDKGTAVEWILDQTILRTHTPDKICVVYIGDDLTDEDGFRAVQKYPNNLCVIVAESLDRPTLASARLRDPEEVKKFLRQLRDVLRLE